MSGFTVSGVLDNTLYDVEVTGDASNPVVGSKRVSALVTQQTGTTVLATPGGPRYTVDPGDPASVLCLLSAQTKVQSVGDGAPKLVD
jgi:hypothetical protein